jgi:hypothetical protein
MLSRTWWRPRTGRRSPGGVTDHVLWPVVVVSVQGLGGDFAEEPVFRCEPATLATEPFLECPAQAR